jgi:thioredoxin 1
LLNGVSLARWPVRLERLVTEHGGALDALWEKKKTEKQAAKLEGTGGGDKEHGNVVIAQSREHLRKVLEDAGSKPVVIDFYADWCGPCRMMSPKIEAYSKQYEGSAVFVKVDTDALGEVCDQCEVRALPTFCVFKNGKKVDQIVGANPTKLESSFKSHM